MTEIIAIVVVAIVIGHNEWRYRRLQESIDVVGTTVGELVQLVQERRLKQ